MERGLLDAQMKEFERIGAETEAKAEWQRRESFDNLYEFGDAIKGGYGVFYFQHPSMLNFQDSLKRDYRRENVGRILDLEKVPCNNQITKLLDEVEPGAFRDLFMANIMMLDRERGLDSYRVLDGGVLLALDGVWFFSSQKVHCGHCLHRSKDGETTYFHAMMSTAIVKPSDSVVLPLMPEMIRNEDGKEKQDCERNAVKRWLEEYKSTLKWLKPTFLGDDLYACYPVCKMILDAGFSFIFTCKPSSHPYIKEQTEGAPFQTHEAKEWNGRNHLVHRYKWLNGIESRSDDVFLHVNYIDHEIYNIEKKKVTYHNSWITDKTVNADNVVSLVKCARARWKIENEHNNVLKNRGYNLDHNFGHGEKHASDVYCILNLLAFQIHGIMMLLDDTYKRARERFRRRDEFFAALRFCLSRFPFDSLNQLLEFVMGDAVDD